MLGKFYLLMNGEPDAGGGGSLLGGTGGGDPAPAGDPAPPADPGSNIPDFLKGMEPEWVNDPIMKDVRDVPTLVKNYVNTKKLVGQKGYVLPNQNSSEDDWNNLFKAIGLPETTENYKYEGQEDLDPDFIKGFNETAHKAGILPKQAQQLMGFYKEMMQKVDTDLANEHKETIAQGLNNLKQEWGEAFPKKLQMAQGVLKTFGDESMVKYLNESGLGNDINLIKLLNKIGESMKEDTFQNNVVSDFHKSPAEAQAEINEIMTDKNHPYWNPDHQDHKKMVGHMQKLFKTSTRS